MPPRIPPDRIESVVVAAARVFVRHGYRRAQVQDVADELGVAKGTVYGYAESKEALFAAAIRYGDGQEPLPGVADLPLPTPPAGAVEALVAERLGAEVAQLAVVRAAAAPDATVSVGDVVLDLYARLARHRIAIKIVDRCAPELPDLGRVWFGDGRAAQVGVLDSYLTGLANAGRLTLPGPAPLVARTIVESCALWAVHCHFDPGAVLGGSGSGVDDGAAIDDPAVAAMLATLFTKATAYAGSALSPAT
jgi:AcrR family transcriptional regulator